MAYHSFQNHPDLKPEVHMECFIDGQEIDSAECSLKRENDLEKNHSTNLQSSLKVFFAKGGTLQVVKNCSAINHKSIQLLPHDIIYPICSGGFCRSQTLWALLKQYDSQITLFPPHAARFGWDPYNGKINRSQNIAKEQVFDEFEQCFGFEKSMRFGFENAFDWNSFETNPSLEDLQSISHYYNQHYYGSQDVQKNLRRVYIAFANNAHVVLHRLSQANESLNNVHVIAINSEDIITTPPDFLMTPSRSKKAYAHFAELIHGLLDFQFLDN